MIAARLGIVERRRLWTAATLTGPARVGVLVRLVGSGPGSPNGGAIAGEPDPTDGGHAGDGPTEQSHGPAAAEE